MYVCMFIYICTTLHGWIKGKSRDTFEMYPGKVMHMIGG